MLKIGLIGCGGIAATHAHSYNALGDRVKVVAVADAVPEKAAEMAKLVSAERVYATGAELIANEQLDFVDICVPTYLHAELAVQAMKQGMNVFLEKPVCMNEEEAELLLKTEQETGAIVQVGLCVRFNDACDYLKKAREDGRFGKLLAVTFERVSPRPTWSWQNWYMDPDKSGSMALDLHVHNADFVRYLMGEPEKLTATASRGADTALDHIYVTYEYPETVISVEDGWGYPGSFPFSETFRAKFEKATLVCNENGLTVYPEEGEAFSPEFGGEMNIDMDMGINITSLGEYFNELDYFTDKLTKGETPDRATLTEAIQSVRLVWKEIELCGGKTLR